MKMRRLPLVLRMTLLVVCLPALWPLLLTSKAAAERPPNILMIVADDLGYADVSFTGGAEIPTPQIDRLADEGVVLDQFYVSQPFCGPSRAAFLTGRFPQRFGMDNNPREPEDLEGMPPSEITLAEVLRDVGYRTGLVGKWHLGATEPMHPNNQGFDYFYGTRFGGHQYFPGKKPRGKWSFYGDNVEENGQPVSHEKYLTDQLTDAALAFLEEEGDETPWFLFLSYTAPHTPLQAPDELIAEFAHLKDEKRRVYAGMVRSLDNNVGRVLDWLDASGEADDTVVLFFSDNGGRTDKGAVNKPYAGRKGDPLEGGVRVPFVLRWPERVPAGHRSDDIASALDLFPTLAVAAGAELPDVPLDGQSLGPLLVEGSWSPEREALYWRQVEREIKGIRRGNWKWGHTRHGLEFLFDIANDPYEQKNLLDRLPETAAELERRFNAWSDHMAPPAW